jgi:hypothetical protein
MSIIQLLSSDYYEIFEYHNAPRGLKILTLRVNKKGASQFIKHRGRVNIPIGALCTYISDNEELPEYANFVYERWITPDCTKYAITKSFSKIHKRIDSIKEALSNSNLKVAIKGKDIPPYVKGTRYDNKGIYQGINEDENGKFYYFADNVNNHREYINK